MYRTSRPLLMFALLVAFGLRTVLGAPCCIDPVNAAPASDTSEHAHHHADADHSDHSDRPTANPCCSACGPTLPPDPAPIAGPSAIRTILEPAPIQELATRPPYPAYEATGPPLLT